MRKILFLSLALTLSVGLWAIDGVHYIDAKGQEQTVNNVTEITNASSGLNAGWYVVTGTDVKTGTLTCNGAVHLILADGAKLTATGWSDKKPEGIRGGAGIQVSGKDSTLTIYGQKAQSGQLIANGGENAAGIGGGHKDPGSNITINGGIITATAGEGAAGIGGGSLNSGSNITINGGTVTAIGMNYGAGIGGGWNCSGSNITINGGIIRATNQYTLGKEGSDGSAGIGGGNKGSGSNITINGGSVTAKGGPNAAGIGGGSGASGSNIFVDKDLVVKADNFNPPTTVITNDGFDLASQLAGQRYATIETPFVALPTLPYEEKVRKGSVKVIENGHFRIIREGKAYMIMGVEE